MSLDLSSLENAVIQLREVLDLCDSDVAHANPLYRKHWRTAAIKTFEYTYELSVKMITRHLEMTLSNPSDIKHMSFSNIIRTAYGKSLLLSDHTAWLEYRKRRGTTSHTYDEIMAQKILQNIPDFLDEARYLLKQLQEESNRLERPS